MPPPLDLDPVPLFAADGRHIPIFRRFPGYVGHGPWIMGDFR
jgi:hypothetical protein